MKPKSKSRIIAEKTIFETFKILKAAGGRMKGRDVVEKIRQTVKFDDYENEIYEKTGNVRWESVLHFYTIGCMKAGFMLKDSGDWILTPEGEKAMALGAEKLIDAAKKIYRQWKTANATREDEEEISDEEEVTTNGAQQKAILEQFEEKAAGGIREHILSKNPYEFQEMVAHLLSAMGYHISHIAEKGPDGGIDIIAYTDPLGTTVPRIIAQVKHRPNSSVASEDIQKLLGTLKRGTDVGIFVTSGQFSTPAIREARNSHRHIELIDLDRFVKMWKEYYHKLTDEQKNMLPLYPIYFLGTAD